MWVGGGMGEWGDGEGQGGGGAGGIQAGERGPASAGLGDGPYEGQPDAGTAIARRSAPKHLRGGQGHRTLVGDIDGDHGREIPEGHLDASLPVPGGVVQQDRQDLGDGEDRQRARGVGVVACSCGLIALAWPEPGGAGSLKPIVVLRPT